MGDGFHRNEARAALLSLALVFASLFKGCSVFQVLWTVRIYP